jgi:formate hydrogenlyase transcriptional activator
MLPVQTQAKLRKARIMVNQTSDFKLAVSPEASASVHDENPGTRDGDAQFGGVVATLASVNEDICAQDERRVDAFPGIVGQSEALRKVLQQVEMVAPTDSTVLLLGETGTGKELIARAIHDRSSRKNGTLVNVNCAAIPGSLLESELFGHERGAYTGAICQKIGRIELADQGSLFLDEIGDIPLEMQPKLLRVLQEREIERLGSAMKRKVNVRVMAATHRHLNKMVLEKQFRSDLYYRVNVFPIYIPPLRERPEDIPLLVRHFVHRFARQMNKTIGAISSELMETLIRYPWPGNIRELQNVIERSVILSSSEVFAVDESWLSKEASRPAAQVEAPAAFQGAVEPRSEREIIKAALAESKGRVSGPSGAAAKLGMPPSTLDRWIKTLKIDKRRLRYA